LAVRSAILATAWLLVYVATERNDSDWLNYSSPSNASAGFVSFFVTANWKLPASGFFVPLHEPPTNNYSSNRMALCKKSGKSQLRCYLQQAAKKFSVGVVSH